MAEERSTEILKSGIENWNRWRAENPLVVPDLTEAQLNRVRLKGANLERVDLGGAQLLGADLREASLYGASLVMANLWGADLRNADLRKADLQMVNFNAAKLSNADLGYSMTGATMFGDLDLSGVKGLESVRHVGPSNIGVDTLYRSNGNIPITFLRGCGVPEEFSRQIPYILGFEPVIQFYSCFISYNGADEAFAQRLYARLRNAKVRVWFAPEDVRGGEKLHEQVYNAIQVHDRLLVVLSSHSLKSEWVMTEIRRARRAELSEGRRKLFPIRLVDYETIGEWQCFDPDSRKDLGVEVREYFIPDFSDWQNEEAFERSFSRLLRDLKAEEMKAHNAGLKRTDTALSRGPAA